MSLLDDLEKVFEEVKEKLVGKVGAEVEGDVHAVVNDAKAQATALVKEAGADAQADASVAAADASKVASDAGQAVAPPAS